MDAVPRPFEIGLFAFGEVTAVPGTGRPVDPAIRLREFVELATLASSANGKPAGMPDRTLRKSLSEPRKRSWATDSRAAVLVVWLDRTWALADHPEHRPSAPMAVGRSVAFISSPTATLLGTRSGTSRIHAECGRRRLT